MTEASPTPVPPMGLLARAIGIITSPKATFQNVVAAPRPFGILFICALVIGIGGTIPQLTEQGRQQSLDMQVRTMERFGQTVTPEAYQRMEERSHNVALRLSGAVGSLVALPIFALIFTAVYWAFFNAILGGTASFKQVLAVVAHSYVIAALGVVAGLPVQLYSGKISMGGPFNLGALAPGLDASSTLARFLGNVSLFGLWGSVVTAIGLAVLYRRKTTNIAIVLILIYLLFTYAVSAVFGPMFG